jgi:uncharacterized iron-regulated membrane protein
MKRTRLITLDRVHRNLGSFMALLFVIIGFTGAVSVFRYELDVWGNPETRQPATGSSRNLQLVVDSAVRDRELSSIDRLVAVFPENDGEAMRVFVVPGADAASDEFYLNEAPPPAMETKRNHAADLLFQIHAYLLTNNKIGRSLVGLVGLAFVVSITTGFYTYRHRLRDLFRMEWHRGLRRSSADAHKAIGIWALGFHFVIGLSGAYLGLQEFFVLAPASAVFSGDLAKARSELAPERLIRSGEPTEMVSLDSLLEKSRQAIPGMHPNLLSLEMWGDTAARATVRGEIPGHLLRKHESFQVTLEGQSGRVLNIENALEAPLSWRIYQAIAPLHYGNMAGPGLKWLYFVLGISTTALSLTGLMIRFTRRRRTTPTNAAV